MQKTALFVFNGDPMCFIHVLLNALDMKARGIEAAIVVEGAATALLPELNAAGNPLNGLWKKVLSAKLVAGVCLAFFFGALVLFLHDLADFGNSYRMMKRLGLPFSMTCPVIRPWPHMARPDLTS